MTNLYLIAHKVRSEPAFDIAIRVTCRLCQPGGDDFGPGCHECDGEGYWWIIPTSGHRAYPYWWTDTELLSLRDGEPGNILRLIDCGTPPPDLPDHYIAQAAPKTRLSELLGLRQLNLPLLPPITRRI